MADALLQLQRAAVEQSNMRRQQAEMVRILTLTVILRVDDATSPDDPPTKAVGTLEVALQWRQY